MNTGHTPHNSRMRGRHTRGRHTALKFGRALRSLSFILSFALAIIAPNTRASDSRHDRAQSDAGSAQPKNAADTTKKPPIVQPVSGAKTTSGVPSNAPQKFVHEGVEIEFTIDRIADQEMRQTDLMEGDDAVVSFKITESRNGTPLGNLHPSAWMDLRAAGKITGSKDCRQKIQSFLQAALSARPEIDLNTYYILALNKEANISVIDPLMGYGNSKLFTLVFLRSPGEDWILGGDKKRLFVTMPLVSQVAVVDTSTWRVSGNIDTGGTPSKIALQPDEKYLWVGNDAADSESGVTAIDAVDLKVAKRIKTGAGHHEIAFSGDSRFAYVTNKQDGTLSVIDVQKLEKVKDIKTGGLPGSLAFSPLSKAVYAASEEDGAIVVIGGENHDVLTRIAAKPGLKSIRFAADGRYGFAVNGKENCVHVFDSSTNRVVHTIAVRKNPDRISFTQKYAYVRSLGSDQVSMIQLGAIGSKGEVPVVDFPGGQLPPEKAPGLSMADAIVAAPEGGSVLVANPADKMIYYYSEGMAAPMGSFQNYRREPRAVMVWDKSLRELKPGVYSTNVKLITSGEYDVAFLLDSPRIAHCFSATIKPNPALKKEMQLPINIEPMITDARVRVGEIVKLQFQVTDSTTRLPKDGLKDVGVLVFLSPGIWQSRQWAQPIGDGKYEVSFKPAQPGPYYVFTQCPSLKVRYNQTPYFILQAREEKPAPAAPTSK